MYELKIDKDAIHWDSDQIAEYLEQRCLQNPPSPYQTILSDVWREILGPFFANKGKHSPIKRRVVLLSEFAEVDAIWAQVGALHFPIKDACSAIAFVLSTCLPSFPSNDWVSMAAVFVHFCRLALRSFRPKTVRILWHSQPRTLSSSDQSSSHLSPEHDQRQRRDETRAIILIDDNISNARATSISPSSNSPPDTYDLSHDAINNQSNPKPKVFRPQTPEELLDTLGLGGIWPLWDLSSASPDAGIVPQTPGGPKSDFNFSRNRWPHSCRCSAIMPVIHAINAQKLVRGVAFAFKPFSSFLKQYKRGEFPHHALQDAVQPWCAACCIMYKRIGVRFEDLASDPSKEPLASVSYTDADDLEVPEYDSDLPTRPSSATSSMHRPAQDPHSALPSSSRHTLPPPPSHMPHRSNSSPRVLPEQVSSDRDSATPSRRSTPLIQRSWMRSPTISRGQTFNQQAPPQESQESKGDAPFNALNSHARPSPTPPMPRLQPGATGDKLGQFGVASELRRSPLTRSPIHASGSYPPRPSSAGASHLHNVAKADTQYHRPPSVSGYTTPPFSPQSSHRSTTRQAPVLPEPLHSSPSRSKKNRPRPTPEGSQAPHPYLADQPSAFATFSSPIDASGMHIPRTESTSWTMYQPAPATDPTDYDSWKGQQQPPIADFPNHHTASASHHWQSSPPYPIQHQPQPYAYAPQWPSPSGYPTGVQPSRLPTTPGSNPHFPSAQHPPHRHDHEQHNLYHGGPDYEVVHHQLPMQQQQNYRGGPTSSTPYQMYTPRAHHQPPQPESFYPSPSHSYPRTHAMSRETEYNYNDDTRLYEKVNPVYPR